MNLEHFFCNLYIFFDIFIILIYNLGMKKKENKKTITKDMIIDDVLKLDESLGDIFMGFGMHCIFCHLGMEETVEEAAFVHQVDVDFLIEKLNEAYKANK